MVALPLKSKTLILPAAGALLGLGILAFGWHWLSVGRYIETTDNAYVQADISVVSPQVQGYVREVAVTDNQRVKAGDVLVVIDDREFRAKVAEARAAVEGGDAAIATVERQLTHQQAKIAEAAADRASAEAERAKTQQDLLRYQALARESFASRQRLEASEADHRKADANVQKMGAALAAERDQVSVLDANRHQAEAQLEQAKANLALAELDLERTVIRAPVDGVVGNRGVQVGQMVKPGTQLLSVVPLTEAYIVANFKETQIARMEPGQTVDIKVDTFPGVVLHGRIDSFSPGTGAQWSLLPPENATGNFTKIVQRVPVKITLEPDQALSGRLRPGLSVIATVDTRSARQGAKGLGTAAAPAETTTR
ncbi:MAG: HlyD family secretion protein [Alphaproteobacteria bacterium]